MSTFQAKEQEASHLYARGEIDAAVKIVWEVLEQQPKSPVSALGFKICRVGKNQGLAAELRKFLEERNAFNDQAKLDWVIVQIALGQASNAAAEVADLVSSSKSIAFRLHVIKALTAHGVQVGRSDESVHSVTWLPISERFQDVDKPSISPKSRLVNPATYLVEPTLISENFHKRIGETSGDSDTTPQPAVVLPSGRLFDSKSYKVDINQESEQKREAVFLTGQDLALRARVFGESRNLPALFELYMNHREVKISGNREYYLTVALKSVSEIAKSAVITNQPLEIRIDCLKFAELILGDLLETRWNLKDQQLGPMIETHLAADRPRSAMKYLRWSFGQQSVSFRYHFWPFMLYLRRLGNLQALLDFMKDVTASGYAPDTFAVALVCRELIRENRASDAHDYLEERLSAGLAMDSHMLMAGLESLEALDRRNEMQSLLTRAMTGFVPDHKAFGFVADNLYSAGKYAAVAEVVQQASSLGVSDDALMFRRALASWQNGESEELIYLLPRLSALDLHPYRHLELLDLLTRHEELQLVSEICNQIRLSTRQSEIRREEFQRAIEMQLAKVLFDKNHEWSETLVSLLKEINSESPLVTLYEIVSCPAQLEVASVELSTAFENAICRESGLSDFMVKILFLASSKNMQSRPAFWLLDELVRRNLANSWHLGSVLEDFVRLFSPDRLESLYQHYLPRIGTIDEHSHQYLFNILIKAYRYAGRRQDVERLREMMKTRGVPEDEWTLREVLEISRSAPSTVGVSLGGTNSIDFEALRRVLDDLRHELSHFVAQISLRLQAVGDGLDKTINSAEINGIQEVLSLTRKFSERVEGYSDIADPDMAGICDLGQVIQNTIKEFQSKPAAQRLKLAVSKTNDQYWCSISGYGLRTVMQNLFENALSEFSSVEVDNPSIEVSIFGPKMARLGDLVSISIRDNGRGISPGIAEEIFIRGFTTRSGHGFGLGLALVRSIIESVGGTIQLVQDGIPGAHFLIQLRLSEAPGE